MATLNLTPAERVAYRYLMRQLSSTPIPSRDENGTLMAITRQTGYALIDGAWVEACGHGVSLGEACDGCDEGNAIADNFRMEA